MTPDLKQMPSYAGLHYIMSQKHFTPRTILEVEQQYAQVDINLLLEDVVTEEQAPNTDKDYWSEKTTKEIEKYVQLNLEEDE